MAEEPLINDMLALTEKKLDMTLDDLIKMSKKNSSQRRRRQRVPIKSQGIFGNNTYQGTSKLRQFMDSRSSIRQGVLASKRSHFQWNQFPMITEVAKKAASVPVHNWVVNWNKRRFAAAPAQKKATESSLPGKGNVMGNQKPWTLDARFASIKELRMRGPQRSHEGHRPVIGRNKARAVSFGHQSGNFAR
ncbi:Ribosomal protein S18 protein [Dioscorea alata]|uniref:Ribosomal protein S18 protein n=2 Tax=Dioscorea alata TaxID=55571 RepID=A0ACB7WDX1_DIOAL|nr:Ribosomal protein S18 protein [Dioscorea alata]KAH7685896.1 Ribosomal protein S18 protein [Dioscorea alata]